MKAAAFAVLLAAALCTPAVARAHGDPASDYLLGQSLFLPFNAKVDPDAHARLKETIRAAGRGDFRIKVAVIGSRYDLGTAFSLFNKAQKYAELLGLELSFQYRDRLLVVMPNGFGYSITGKPDAVGSRVLKPLPQPGTDPTKQVKAATAAIRKLAAASRHALPAASSGAGGSNSRDRITIAAGAVVLAAVLAAIVFWRRGRAPARK